MHDIMIIGDLNNDTPEEILERETARYFLEQEFTNERVGIMQCRSCGREIRRATLTIPLLGHYCRLCRYRGIPAKIVPDKKDKFLIRWQAHGF